METTNALAVLTALGHATRLAIFRLLVEAGPDGRMAGDIAEALGVPPATLSFHLKDLSHAGLVEGETRGRFVCYRANYAAMNGLIDYLTRNCCAGSADAPCAPGTVCTPAFPAPRRILFVCTGNSARSVLSEATLNAWGGGRFAAFSAGSQPTGRINPFAIAQLQADGIAADGLRSKSWDEFSDDAAPALDLVVTVCDSAAAETCPVFFGDVLRTHWGLPDPAGAEGSAADKTAAFARAHATIKARLRALIDLPEALWSQPDAMGAALHRIGSIDA